MDSSASTPSRRTVLATAAGSAFIALTGAAAPATAAPVSSRPATRAPRTIDLPVGIRPEGITSGPGTTYYVGSLADGRIVTGDLIEGTVDTLLPGATGRSIRGLYWDRRTNLVWAAGNVLAEAHVWAVDADTGEVVSDTVVPGAAFLNDLVVTQDAVWVTDSRLVPDRLTKIPLGRRGAPIDADPEFVPLGGAWPAGNGTDVNANGIRELPDGTLILNNSRVGGLWQVRPGSGRARRIRVEGGPGIIAGDGLELDGRTLYNVRGSGPDQVAVLRLSRDGDSWVATWVGARKAESLSVPSTATVAGGWLWVVNARFGVVPDPTTAPYWITRLRA
jgi:hypothetical protein